MGAGVSAGESNDELIDNLVEADYIKTSLIERVFRAVDRGNYILPDPQINPYRDVAWKNHNFHISAPCIYSEVMEGLQLQAGMSFLNLGSGTGYLNTIIGLILGHNGINHGIEFHQEVINYANKKLEEFKMYSSAIDEYDFCEPKFVQGNCLCIANGHYLYDRVYCGAACPDEYLDFVRNLVKVGGILIVPFNERLVEMKRTSETNWNIRSLLPVSFANLIIPPKDTTDEVHLLNVEPLTLQELCRSCIRNLIRKTIEKEHPTITKKNNSRSYKTTKNKRIYRRGKLCNRTNRNGHEPRVMYNRDGIIDDFIFLISNRSLTRSSVNNDDETTSENESNTEMRDNEQQPIVAEYAMSDDNNDDDGDNGGDDGDGDNNGGHRCIQRLRRVVDILSTINNTPEASTTTTTNDNTTPSTSTHDDNNMEHCDNVDKTEHEEENDYGMKRKTSIDNDDDVDDNNSNHDDSDDEKNTTNGDGLQSPQIDIETDSSSNDEFESDLTNDDNRCRRKWRRLDSFNDEMIEEKSSTTSLKVYKSPYTDYMKEKIKELPLPFILKKYLNFYRDF